jgi:hypothetical protein
MQNNMSASTLPEKLAKLDELQQKLTSRSTSSDKRTQIRQKINKLYTQILEVQSFPYTEEGLKQGIQQFVAIRDVIQQKLNTEQRDTDSYKNLFRLYTDAEEKIRELVQKLRVLEGQVKTPYGETLPTNAVDDLSSKLNAGKTWGLGSGYRREKEAKRQAMRDQIASEIERRKPIYEREEAETNTRLRKLFQEDSSAAFEAAETDYEEKNVRRETAARQGKYVGLKRPHVLREFAQATDWPVRASAARARAMAPAVGGAGMSDEDWVRETLQQKDLQEGFFERIKQIQRYEEQFRIKKERLKELQDSGKITEQKSKYIVHAFELLKADALKLVDTNFYITQAKMHLDENYWTNFITFLDKLPDFSILSKLEIDALTKIIKSILNKLRNIIFDVKLQEKQAAKKAEELRVITLINTLKANMKDYPEAAKDGVIKLSPQLQEAFIRDEDKTHEAFQKYKDIVSRRTDVFTTTEQQSLTKFFDVLDAVINAKIKEEGTKEELWKIKQQEALRDPIKKRWIQKILGIVQKSKELKAKLFVSKMKTKQEEKDYARAILNFIMENETQSFETLYRFMQLNYLHPDKDLKYFSAEDLDEILNALADIREYKKYYDDAQYA